MKRKTLIALATCILLANSATALSRTTTAPAPANAKTLLERLGYPPETKLLIVHADDLGMAHTINVASIKGLESGLVSQPAL